MAIFSFASWCTQEAKNQILNHYQSIKIAINHDKKIIIKILSCEVLVFVLLKFSVNPTVLTFFR